MGDPYQQQYAQPGYAQPGYAPQPGYAQPVDPYASGGYAQQTTTVQYSQPPPVAVQQTTVQYSQPVVAQAPPQQHVVVVSQPGHINSNEATSAWVLFICGFFFPICWCIGIMYIRSKDPSARIAAFANLAFAIMTIIGIIIAIIVAVTFARAVVRSPSF